MKVLTMELASRKLSKQIIVSVFILSDPISQKDRVLLLALKFPK